MTMTRGALTRGASGGADGERADGSAGPRPERDAPADAGDRGDVPGWVLVTLMTAGLVLGLWAVADTALTQMFTDAMNDVQGR